MEKALTSPFLKWAGGKRRLLPTLLPLLPAGSRLIEPFVGAGSVFLASGYPDYILGDSNPVLMALYQWLKHDPVRLHDLAAALFSDAHHSESAYLRLRARFNSPSTHELERVALFLYLNRFGFNGLYRTNRQGCCNTPYGHPSKLPGFPGQALLACAEKLRHAELVCGDFEVALRHTQPGDVIYCDPPYADRVDQASFTAYGMAGFSWQDHQRLASCARTLAREGCVVLISNHATPDTERLYTGATLHRMSVRRSIAGKASARGCVDELVAVFTPDN